MNCSLSTIVVDVAQRQIISKIGLIWLLGLFSFFPSKKIWVGKDLKMNFMYIGENVLGKAARKMLRKNINDSTTFLHIFIASKGRDAKKKFKKIAF